MIEFNKVLDANEKVLWEGKPQFLPYLLSVAPFMLFGFVFMVFSGFIVFPLIIKTGTLWPLLIPHFWIGFVIFFGAPLYSVLVYKYLYYIITDKRIIFQSGLIGRDFKMVDYNQVTNAEVNVGVLDKLFGKNSGSILVSSAGTFAQGRYGPIAKPYVMSNITDPYEVFKFFKQVSYDIKTDIQYPNKLRPSENPGYKTDYNPDKK